MSQLQRIPISTWSLAVLCASVTIGGCHQTQSQASAIAPRRTADSVAVGYGSQQRRDVTGAVGSLDGDVARRNSPTSVADMIDGRFAGVEVRRLPTGGISVRVRGSRSLNSEQEPLYVVDGVPQRIGGGGVLTDIDPRDIKSIEVLKDAGSTAVYGSRGANGVILISTKRP